MTVSIEKYNPSKDMCNMFLEFMNKLANEVRSQTSAPEGACALASIMVVKTLVQAMEEGVQILSIPEGIPETKH